MKIKAIWISFSPHIVAYNVLTNFVAKNTSMFVRCALILLEVLNRRYYFRCDGLVALIVFSAYVVKISFHSKNAAAFTVIRIMSGRSSPSTVLARSKIGLCCRISAAVKSIFHDWVSCSDELDQQKLQYSVLNSHVLIISTQICFLAGEFNPKLKTKIH